MPGTNHDVAPTFMDALPFSVRDASLDLIRYYSLKDLLEMRQTEPNAYLKEKFNLSPMQWNQVLNAVILTKVSYFEISLHFPNKYIDKLHEIAAYAFGMPGKSPADLYQAMISDHPQFAKWLTNSLIAKQQNLRLIRNEAKVNGLI